MLLATAGFESRGPSPSRTRNARAKGQKKSEKPYARPLASDTDPDQLQQRLVLRPGLRQIDHAIEHPLLGLGLLGGRTGGLGHRLDRAAPAQRSQQLLLRTELFRSLLKHDGPIRPPGAG